MSLNFRLVLTLLSTWTLAILQQSESSGLCWDQRANLSENDFVPECTDDGNFKPVQCDSKTGYCFCVDPFTGRPYSQTSTRKRLPNCNRKNHHQQQKHNNDNSPQRRQYGQPEPYQPVASSLTSVESAPNKKKRPGSRRRCTEEQRVSYVNKLVGSVTSQIRRQNTQYPLGIPLGMVKPTDSGTVHNSLMKKFHELDRDKDFCLSVNEFQQMNERTFLLGCANSMFDFCDQNYDLTIDRNEFGRCLDAHHVSELNGAYMIRKRQRKQESRKASRNHDENRKNTAGSGDLFPFAPINIPLSESLAGNNPKSKKKESRLDCLVIKANLIESLRLNPKSAVFIPECTADGHYVRVQCHSLYCWCVSNVTGEPIKRLNKNSTENLEACDLMRKDCDQKRRRKFHLQFQHKLSAIGQSCDSVYDQIDSGRDQQIDDQEFQKFMRQSPELDMKHRLKKCIRTEVYYCDQDDDGQLTRQEWIQCCHDNITSPLASSTFNQLLNPHHPASSRLAYRDSGFPGSPSSIVEAINQKKNRIRTGTNPLKILKSE